MSTALDSFFDEQEREVLQLLENDVVKGIIAGGVEETAAGILPASLLTTASLPVVNLMERSYSKAVSDNVEEGYGSQVDEATQKAANSTQASTVISFNQTTQKELVSALTAAVALEDDDGGDVDVALKLALAYSLIKAVFNKLRFKRKQAILDSAVYGPYNQGLHDSAVALEQQTGRKVSKQWVSLMDGRVRDSHQALHGDKVDVGSSFFVKGVPIRFPRDPLAPVHLTINCRCVLKFGN